MCSQQESTADVKLCNFRKKKKKTLAHVTANASLALNAKCVVYKATVTETTSNNQETYIGLTENEFKTRFNLHK